jgi:hypothetical protein
MEIEIEIKIEEEIESSSMKRRLAQILSASIVEKQRAKEVVPD